MHDDEYREEQKQEMVKLMCLMTAFMVGLMIWALAYQGIVCMISHGG